MKSYKHARGDSREAEMHLLKRYIYTGIYAGAYEAPDHYQLEPQDQRSGVAAGADEEDAQVCHLVMSRLNKRIPSHSSGLTQTHDLSSRTAAVLMS